ncbi:MAG: hypothetical protein LBD95_01720 [Clostridiales Family XIII bacterium]|nr:hypothetical protein [Clostridiales Family XIII bacterium]
MSGKINDLNDALPKIKSADRNEAEKILKDFGFDKRKNEKNEPLEEDAQAAFVRDVIVNKFDGFTFIATEFVLFGFGGKNGGEKRPDVFVLREGILYDVELKNKRKGPSEKAGMGYSAITQAQEYVAHMKEPDNYDKYIRCLAAFPNGTSGEIKDIRGVALVPATASGGSSGTLEAAAKAAGVELWTFDKDKDYKIEKIICA